MLNKFTLLLKLVMVWFASLVSGQDPGVEDPLPEFLSRLSASTQSVVAVRYSSSGGPEGGYTRFFRSKGEFGVIGDVSQGEGEREVRSIWNPKYRAVIKKIDQEKWALQRVYPQDDKEGYRSQDVVRLFVGPLSVRSEFLELVEVTKESDGVLCEYRYSPDYPSDSSDPVFKSCFIKFNNDSENGRLLEFRHWEGGDEMKISSSLIYEYPEDSFFPLKRIGKAVVVGGEMGGTKFEMEDRVEIDTDSKFVSSECYLSHYGLPEPNIPSDYAWLNRPITWIGVGLFLVLCCMFLVSRVLRRR